MAEVIPFLLHPITTDYLCYCLLQTRDCNSIVNYLTLSSVIRDDGGSNPGQCVAHGLKYFLFQYILKRSLTAGAQTGSADYAE